MGPLRAFDSGSPTFEFFVPLSESPTPSKAAGDVEHRRRIGCAERKAKFHRSGKEVPVGISIRWCEIPAQALLNGQPRVADRRETDEAASVEMGASVFRVSEIDSDHVRLFVGGQKEMIRVRHIGMAKNFTHFKEVVRGPQIIVAEVTNKVMRRGLNDFVPIELSEPLALRMPDASYPTVLHRHFVDDFSRGFRCAIANYEDLEISQRLAENAGD